MGIDPDATLPIDAPNALLAHLRRLREEETSEADTTAVRQHWLLAVEQLLATLRVWLAPAQREGLVRLDAVTVHIGEDEVGAHDAPALQITMPAGRVVWVRPVGTLRIGAQGLIDVVCASSRALLVLNRAGIWKIRGAGSSAPLVPLDAHAFARVLAELIA